MAKFDLGAFAKTLQAVPETGTEGPERIEYIPLDQLHEDSRNFYAVSGVEELAANIQLCGLMDPLRVSKAEDGYAIVSGHRRFAALSLLAKDDPRFAQAACIVDPGTESPQMQELRLIYANADTRRMSSADIARQAERVQELLYELKEQGVDFPGRMRDHVAEACKISKSKLSRLEAIRSHLAPDIRKAYWDGPEKGRLHEAAAYSLSRLPEDYQRQVVDAYRRGYRGDIGLKWLTAGVVDKSGMISRLPRIFCARHTAKNALTPSARCTTSSNPASSPPTATVLALRPAAASAPASPAVRMCARGSRMRKGRPGRIPGCRRRKKRPPVRPKRLRTSSRLGPSGSGSQLCASRQG